ncbi:hypothetical protein D3C76_1361000 [compost metagenome]
MVVDQGQHVRKLALFARLYAFTLLQDRPQQADHRLQRGFAFGFAQRRVAHAVLQQAVAELDGGQAVGELLRAGHLLKAKVLLEDLTRQQERDLA